jgi:L,D-transpeptidase catalytic domain
VLASASRDRGLFLTSAKDSENHLSEACFGATLKPTRETRALPCDFCKSHGFKRNVRVAIALSVFFCATISLRAQTSVEIDLEEQTAYLLQNRRVVLASPISSGRYGHLTERGLFKVLEKERTHYSSMYGKIVDSRGNTIVADADADMPIPSGGKFIPAPMHYFMRFAGADGMHAGYLPGYPASHGCVRMPEQYAIAFFNAVSEGTPVTVYGRTPTGRYLGQSRPTFPSGPNRFRDPRFGARFAPPPPPWWWR